MPAQNPNANRGEHVKPKPAKKKVVGKVKPPASPDQADRTREQTQAPQAASQDRTGRRRGFSRRRIRCVSGP
jgi:hypothetical protein